MIKTFHTLFFLFLLTLCGQAFSQTCEDHNRSTSNFIPDNFPDNINCKDSSGRKQGWWIIYKKSNVWKDIKSNGDSVENCYYYTYGQYKNNLKIGEWTTVEGEHMQMISRTDHYYYAKDTILITSEIGFANGTETIYYNADSSIIKYRGYEEDKSKVTCIDCNSRKYKFEKSCKMTYRNKLISTFPHDQFELKSQCALLMYYYEKERIDNSFK